MPWQGVEKGGERFGCMGVEDPSILFNTLLRWRAVSRSMTRHEWRAFVEQGTRTAKLATTRRDGRPHVVPVWFVLDGDDILFTTGSSSVKGLALRRDGHVCLCVDDEQPPYAFVMVEGEAALSDDLEAVLPVATAIGGRYMGADRADEFGRRNAVPGELLVRVTPTRVFALADVTA
jgi:PPOX class probable F420-dependent enzyme